MNPAIIKEIVEKINIDRNRFKTDARHAHYLGMSVPIYNQIKQGNTEHKLDESRWRNIAYTLGVDWYADTAWKIVKTPTYEYVYAQLTACQQRGISGILCDVPNIGKTVTAKHYAQQNKNAAYVDCSMYKTKDRLVREIARQFGIPNSGSYYTVLDKLIFNILGMDRPLIILDEFDDLYYEAFLEVKGLWNATEGRCGWYALGAEGLQKKIERRIDSKRVGFAEIFSRFGDD
ncbi:MAG: AAA family ATPase, partial [Bacteroides sp.]|nr:AAA family ATPase [Bacteroides sp.]